MKISFSTLGCPDWTVSQAVEAAVDAHYDGIELRFIQGEASLWKLPALSGMGLQETCKEIEASGLTICCVDTSCRFDSPEVTERERWVDEGVRMAELAAQLKAPGIRVFGDKMHPGLNREVTRKWIVESLNLLSEKIDGSGVEVLLETHGDFCCASQLQPILNECPAVRLVWDAAPAFINTASGHLPMEMHSRKQSGTCTLKICVKQPRSGFRLLPEKENFRWLRCAGLLS